MILVRGVHLKSWVIYKRFGEFLRVRHCIGDDDAAYAMTVRNRGPDARIELHIVFRKHEGRIAARRQHRITHGRTAERRDTYVVKVFAHGFQARDYRMPGGEQDRGRRLDDHEEPG